MSTAIASFATLGRGLAAGLLGILLAGSAAAQIRPAYTKNVDEPGRAPVQKMVEFNTGAGSPSCPLAAFCIVAFDPVPAGKRLVVEQLTILIGTVGGAPNLVAFGDGAVTNSGNVAIVAPDFRASTNIASATLWSLQQLVRVFYEAGTTPKVKIGAPGNFSFVGNASIHGYLIDAAN